MVHTSLGLNAGPGLTEFLSCIHSGEAAPDDAMQSFTPEDPSLPIWVLPAGQKTNLAAGLIGSDTMRAVLEDLRSQCDYVIVDLPPVLGTSDAATLARSMDAVILVGLENRTRDDAVVEAAETLRSAGAPLAGVVLSGVPRSDPGVAASLEYYNAYVSPPTERDTQDAKGQKREDALPDDVDTGELEWTVDARPSEETKKVASTSGGNGKRQTNGGKAQRRRVRTPK